MADLSGMRSAAALAANSPARPLPPAARFVLRGSPQVMTAAGAALGLPIAAEPCQGLHNGSCAALWMGPDEYLIMSDPAQGAAIARQLGDALAGQRHSLVDVSHRQIALELSGPNAATILNAGCPLDLHLTSFPVGMCTRTVLGKADIVLLRTGAESFHIEVWRSFAAYLTRYLAEAAREIAC